MPRARSFGTAHKVDKSPPPFWYPILKSENAHSDPALEDFWVAFAQDLAQD